MKSSEAAFRNAVAGAGKRDSIMNPQWMVMKFGGTSVAGRPQWETIASLTRARQGQGYRVLLVCSAVAGVTNRLTALAENPASAAAVQELIELHRDLGVELGVEEGTWLPRAMTLLQESVARLDRDPGPAAQAGLLAVGEWLSTQLGALFLRQQGVDAAWVDAREALEVRPEEDLSPARQWLSADCAAGPDAALESLWSGLGPVLITQGFIARGPDGRTALLGRGGSDTSAALLAGRLQARNLEIWTDVPGLFSADPRLIPTARLLMDVDYSEALEMAASGARVVHPRCIRAAAETQTPLLIKDVNRPEVSGTRIGAAPACAPGIKTVTCQEGMAVMLLQNLDARRQVGFLAGVFEVFRQRGVSVDLVATSETTTTVAVNKGANHLGPHELDELANDLGSRCTVQRFDDCVCVNLVGRGARTALSRLQSAMQPFDERPLLMVSQSANDLCLSLLVLAGDQRPLLVAAHSALIPHREQGAFGASWEEIQVSGDIPRGRLA
jgi:diaminopimelate decarboxylase/aspartate kinase